MSNGIRNVNELRKITKFPTKATKDIISMDVSVLKKIYKVVIDNYEIV